MSRARRCITRRSSSGSPASGVLEDLKEIGVLKQAYHYWNIEHRLLGHFSFDVLRPEDTTHPFNLHLGQPALAEVILRHLLRVPGVEVRWNTKLVAISQSDDAVTATVETRGRAEGDSGAVARGCGRRAQRDAACAESEARWGDASGVVRGDEREVRLHEARLWAVEHRARSGALGDHSGDRQGGASGAARIGRRAALEAEARALVPERYKLFAPGLADTTPAAVNPYRVHDRCAETFRAGGAAGGRCRAPGEPDWGAWPDGGPARCIPL